MIWLIANTRMMDRLLSGLVALGLAALVWLYARSREQEMLDNVTLPVEVSLTPGQSDHYDLEITGPSQVTVSFRGPPSLIRQLRGMLHRGELRVAIPVVVPDDRRNENRYLDTVRVDAADIHGPPGVALSVLEGRNRIPVTLRRLAERRLPVRLDPAPDERVKEVVLEPATVMVRGPKEILDRIRAIPTQPFVVPFTSEPILSQDLVSGPVPLVRELSGRPVLATPAAVTVRLTLQPRQKLYELTEVPVRFLCPANFVLRPRFLEEGAEKMALRIWGPATEAPPAVVAFIDLTGRNFTPGLYAGEPLRLQLPKDAQLAQDPPPARAFQLESVRSVATGRPPLP